MFGLFHRLKRNRDTDALYSYEDDPSGGGPMISLPTMTRHAGYDAVSENATYAAYPSSSYRSPVVSHQVGGLDATYAAYPSSGYRPVVSHQVGGLRGGVRITYLCLCLNDPSTPYAGARTVSESSS